MGLHGIELLASKLAALPPEDTNPEKKIFSEICTEARRAYMAAVYLKNRGYKKGDIVTLDVVQHAFDVRDGDSLDLAIDNDNSKYLTIRRISDDKFEITHFEPKNISDKSTLKYNQEFVRSVEKRLREKLGSAADFTSADVMRVMNVTPNVAQNIIIYLIRQGLAEKVSKSGKFALYRLKKQTFAKLI